MEHGVVTQQDVALILFLHFMSLPNKRLGGLRRFVVFVTALTFLIANDKMLIKALPLQYCFQQIKSLRYHLMPFQNQFIIQTWEIIIYDIITSST